MDARSLVWALIFTGCAAAQNQTPPTTLNLYRPDTMQAASVSNLQQSGRESLNLGTGTLGGFLPVVNLPQRGGRPLRLGYVINNDTYTLKETSVTYNQYGTANGSNPQTWWLETNAALNWQTAYSGPFNTGGLRLNLPILQADIQYMGGTQQSTTPTNYVGNYCFTNYTFFDWAGGSHSFNGFRDCNPTGARPVQGYTLNAAEASDDSGYRIDLTNSSGPRVIGSDGTVFIFPANNVKASSYVNLGAYSKPFSSIVDPNGNTISFSYPTLTDTLGRIITVNADGGISWPYQTSPTAASATATVTIATSNSGTTVPFDTSKNLNCSIKPPSTYMGGYQAAGYSGPTVQPPYPPTVYSSTSTTLTLADGSFYELTYDPNNYLTKVRYPSGGYHRYEYGVVSRAQEDDGDMMCTPNRQVVVAEHECSLPSGSCSSAAASNSSCQAGFTTGGETTTCYSGDWSGYGFLSMNVTSPLNELTVHEFSAASQNPVIGPGFPGQYIPPYEVSQTTYAANSSSMLKRITPAAFTTPQNCPNNGEWCASQPVGNKTTLYDTHGNVSGSSEHDVTLQYPALIASTKDLDFGGKVLRTATYTYNTGGIYSTTASNGLYHILDHVGISTTQETVTGKSVTSTNTYDGLGKLIQVDTSATNASPISVQAVRNSYGDMIVYKDPMQVAGQHSGSTQIGYDPQSISGCPAAPGSGHPTTIMNALGQTTLYAYDVAGTLKCVQDPNGQVTRYSHDALGRTTEVDTPDSGTTIATYTSVPPLTLSQTVAQGPSTTIVTDGLARSIQQTLSAPEGTICTETFYDADGNVSALNDPQMGCSGAPSPQASIQITYDSLGRKLVQTNEDGTTQRWSYDGWSSTATDEAGKSTVRGSDALGRLVSVTEALGANTTYSYDGFNNLKSVTQSGVSGESARIRTFSFDGFSRLLTANNPETGSVCYGTVGGGSNTCSKGYDLDGNMVAKTDAKGIVESYGYDSLNRLLGRSSSDGSVNQVFTYDAWTNWGGTHANQVGRLARTQNCDAGYAHCEDDLYGYDAVGRVARIEGAFPDEEGHAAHLFTMTYDQAGHQTNLYYGHGADHHDRDVYTGFDSAGRPNYIATVYLNGATLAQNQVYVNAVNYFPDGTLKNVYYGNGLVESRQRNSRLQTCEDTVSNGNSVFMDRQYFFSSSNASNSLCSSTASNNGNIFSVVDGLNAAHSQTYTYDALNRLSTWDSSSFGGAVRHQGFGYDSFGNVNQSNGYPPQGGAPDPLSSGTAYDANNRLINSSFNCLPLGAGGIPGQVSGYDTNGNVLCRGRDQIDARAFVYDADNRITEVWGEQNNNTYQKNAAYAYDVAGNRVYAGQLLPGNQPGTYTEQSRLEYFWFDSHVMAEKDQNGVWTDYIYLNGRQIARLRPTQVQLHAHAEHASGQKCFMLFGQQSLGDSGYTIQQGDMLSFDVNSTGGYGGIQFDSSTASAQIQVYGGNTGSTAHISDNISSLAGVVLTGWTPVFATTATSSDSFLTNATIFSRDGTVTPLFTGQALSSSLAQDSCAVSNPSLVAQDVATPDVLYSMSDQVDTAQLEISASGTLLWRGEFAPYGQELDGQFNPNHYKFAGKERDTESGLDYFGARFYQAGVGRFMSPDWSATAEPVPYASLDHPQSLNLYAYVGNNPIRLFDADGHLGLNSGSPGTCNPGKGPSTCAENEADQQSKNGVPPQGTLQRAAAAVDDFISSGSDLANDHPILVAAFMIGLNPQADAMAESQLEPELEQASTSAAVRAQELAALLGKTKDFVTTAVTETLEGKRIISSSENSLRPAQRLALTANEIAVKGPGHAEVTGVNAARQLGLTPTGVAASRPICSACANFLHELKIEALSILK